jgi:hypothetical protein
MKAAEKEVEQLERIVREATGFTFGPGHEGKGLPPIKLPQFRVLQRQRLEAQRSKGETERRELEEKVAEIEAQIRSAQDRLKALNEGSQGSIRVTSTSDDKIVSRGKTDIESLDDKQSELDNKVDTKNNGQYDSGAIGPGGEFMEFPPYSGNEPPHEWKKAFTQYCNSTKKDLKASLPPEERKNKVRPMLRILCRVLYCVI